MDKTWRDEQLSQINNGTSIFGCIPTEIGRVTYCDSTTGMITSKFTFTAGKIKAIVTGTITGALAIAIFFAGVVLIPAIVLTCISIVCLIYGFHKGTFRGTDYFIGENGFAKISFEKDRHTITSRDVVLYDDIAYLCTRESIEFDLKYSRHRHFTRRYSGTVCKYTFYGKADGYAKTDILNQFEGRFIDKNMHFSDYPENADEDYMFLITVEDEWTRRFRNMYSDQDTIHFPTINSDGDLYQCITLHPHGVRVINNMGRVFDFRYDEIKSVELGENNELKIEHVNHSSRLAGLWEEGDIAIIDYSHLANGKAMLILLNSKI